MNNCFWKHLKSNNRLMMIFSEFQAKKQQQTQQQQQAALMGLVKDDIQTYASLESDNKTTGAGS